jgi:hypothetical protein
MASDGKEPFFDAMIREGVLEKNLFAFYMAMNPSIDDDGSSLTFGYWEEDKIEEGATLDWHPVIDELFWSLQMDDILLDGKSLGICDWTADGTPLGKEEQEPLPIDGGRGRKCMFTPDSGTSHLHFTSWAYPTLLAATAGCDSLPCSEGSDLNFGNLTFVINGVNYDLPSNHWVQRTIEDNDLGGLCHLEVGDMDIYQGG